MNLNDIITRPGVQHSADTLLPDPDSDGAETYDIMAMDHGLWVMGWALISFLLLFFFFLLGRPLQKSSGFRRFK